MSVELNPHTQLPPTSLGKRDSYFTLTGRCNSRCNFRPRVNLQLPISISNATNVNVPPCVSSWIVFARSQSRNLKLSKIIPVSILTQKKKMIKAEGNRVRDGVEAKKTTMILRNVMSTRGYTDRVDVRVYKRD